MTMSYLLSGKTKGAAVTRSINAPLAAKSISRRAASVKFTGPAASHPLLEERVVGVLPTVRQLKAE